MDVIAIVDDISGEMVYFTRGLGIAPGVGDVLAETHILGSLTQTYIYVQNHRGDTVALVNTNGVVVGRCDYGAWGDVVSHTGTNAFFTFSGKHYDANAGLYYYGYRWYDPQAKRWTQPDPSGLTEGLDLYQFCGNDPINNVDRYGLNPLRTVAGWGHAAAMWLEGGVTDYKDRASVQTGVTWLDTTINGVAGLSTDLSWANTVHMAAFLLDTGQRYVDRYDYAVCQGVNPWLAGYSSYILGQGDFVGATAFAEAFMPTDFAGNRQTAGERWTKGIGGFSQMLLMGACAAAKISAARPPSPIMGPSGPKQFIMIGDGPLVKSAIVRNPPVAFAPPDGQVFPIPRGPLVVSPTRSAGVQLTGTTGGGNGLHPAVTGMRIMERAGGPSPQPPRVIYMNIRGQSINPLTGQTQGETHFYFNPDP